MWTTQGKSLRSLPIYLPSKRKVTNTRQKSKSTNTRQKSKSIVTSNDRKFYVCRCVSQAQWQSIGVWFLVKCFAVRDDKPVLSWCTTYIPHTSTFGMYGCTTPTQLTEYVVSWRLPRGVHSPSLKKRSGFNELLENCCQSEYLTPSHELSGGSSTWHPETSGGPERTSQCAR